MNIGEISTAGPSRWTWPQPLYTYDADSGDGHGVRGVTDAFTKARSRLANALRTMPSGASGTIRRACLDMSMSPHPDYRYGHVIARAWRDAGTGAVIFDNGSGGEDAPTSEVSEARR